MGSAKIQGELWGIVAQDWADLIEPGHTQLFTAMLDAANVSQGTKLLDAGCGAGGLSVLAAERGATVSGLDASEAMIDIAQARVPSGDFRVGDLEDLPYEDGSFEVTMACQSFFYAENPIAALRELRRVTQPEGMVVVSSWGKAEKNDLRHVFKALGQFMPGPPKGPGPFALAEPGVTEGMLAQAGLHPVSDGWVDAPWDFTNLEETWRAFLASDSAQLLIRHVPEATIKPVVIEAMQQFQNGSGGGRIERQLRYVVAKTA